MNKIIKYSVATIVILSQAGCAYFYTRPITEEQADKQAKVFLECMLLSSKYSNDNIDVRVIQNCAYYAERLTNYKP